jgi:hypothetical protein
MRKPANNLQQSWRFDWEPPKAVLRDVRTIDWILGRLLIQLLVGQFLVSDVGSDHFLIPTNGRDKVSSRPEFVTEKIPHLALDILRDPNRALPFHVSDDLCHRIFGRYRDQHMDVIRHQMPLLDPAFLAAREIVKYLTQMPFHFHHGLLEGSWRFPKETS